VVCKSHKKILVTFGCNGDVHWAERLSGLSTEWLTAAHYKEKVKGDTDVHPGLPANFNNEISPTFSDYVAKYSATGSDTTTLFVDDF